MRSILLPYQEPNYYSSDKIRNKMKYPKCPKYCGSELRTVLPKGYGIRSLVLLIWFWRWLRLVCAVKDLCIVIVYLNRKEIWSGLFLTYIPVFRILPIKERSVVMTPACSLSVTMTLDRHLTNKKCWKWLPFHHVWEFSFLRRLTEKPITFY